MAELGTKENPFSSFNELRKSNVYYSGDRAVKEVEKRLNRKLLPEEKRIIELEGFVDGYYQDSKGVLTRGVGQTGTYAEGETSLSGFDNAYQEHINRLKAREGMAGFDNYSPSLRQELVQAEYRGDLGQSPTFRKILSTAKTPQDYERAATEFLRNEDYINAKKSGSGVADRMEAVANAVRQEGVALQEKPGFFRSTLTGIRNLLPFKKGGKVPEVYTGTIENIAPSLFDIQEIARRSMMHGNYQDRMEDYAYAREQARRPYVNRYPVDSRGRGARSTAAPMRNQAARMMGFAKGGLINTQGPRPMNNLKTQAQGLAALGRGGDSTLVHMQPEEVVGLQQLAQANGTSLTTNPATGMPEAFNLGGMFKAALPIAAGYFTGGAASPLFGSGAIGSMLSKPLVAGALTGATVAGATGDDPIMGAVSGGFGGMSGAGLNTALMGPGGGYNPFSGGSAVPNPGTYNPALDSTLSTAGGGAAPMAQGPAFGNTNPGAGVTDNIKMNLGNPEMRAMTDADKFGGAQLGKDGRFMVPTGKIAPAGNLEMANAIGGPAASLALGGLEESDFYEDVDFSDPRDKYDPNSKLNLNRDTGIAAALSKDTGLRLYAEGGEVGGGVTGAGLAPGTPVASIGGGVTGRGLPPGAPVAGAMGGAKPPAAPGMESFDSMVASGIHPANAAAMHGMDPRPFLGVPTAPAAGYARKPEVMESPYGASTRSRSTYGGRPKRYATGGYLNTGGEIGDGMSDDIQATINNNQPAALSDGEFVVPADVVSHLGNGSSDAGAKRLYDMMDKVRKARTGTKKQGREINPEKMMPK